MKISKSPIALAIITSFLLLALTAPVRSAEAWDTDGNSVANAILGTTSANQSWDVKVSGTRVLRLERSAYSDNSVNIIGGASSNSIGGSCAGVVIAGGGNNSYPNKTFSDVKFSSIGGGLNNSIDRWANYSVIAGGEYNVLGQYATDAAIGGGINNVINAYAYYSTISGGQNNSIANSAVGSMIPGGLNNAVSGDYSLAAGRRAKANHDGCFVWADTTDQDFQSLANNEFVVRASGGVWFGKTSSVSMPSGRFINTSTGGYLSIGGSWVDNSDRAAKHEFEPVDVRDVLHKVVSMPVTKWSYKAEGPTVRHIGPVAQDFHAAFKLGQDDVSISTLDASGVALAAIQGLSEVIQEKDARIATLEQSVAELKAQLQVLAVQIKGASK